MGLWTTLLKRSLTRYFNQPASVRNAMRVISGATLMSVLGSAILMRIFEPDEYPNLGVALWWAIQTVTTVGYGDVTPTSAIGRLIGAVVMLQSIAFITVVTAYITSSFVERVRHQQSAEARSDAMDGEHRLHARFDELAARLDQLERTIDAARDRTSGTTKPAGGRYGISAAPGSTCPQHGGGDRWRERLGVGVGTDTARVGTPAHPPRGAIAADLRPHGSGNRIETCGESPASTA